MSKRFNSFYELNECFKNGTFGPYNKLLETLEASEIFVTEEEMDTFLDLLTSDAKKYLTTTKKTPVFRGVEIKVNAKT